MKVSQANGDDRLWAILEGLVVETWYKTNTEFVIIQFMRAMLKSPRLDRACWIEMAKCISTQGLIYKLPTTCGHSRFYDSVVDKVNEPTSNISVIQTPIFECYVVRCGCENGHQEDMCS